MAKFRLRAGPDPLITHHQMVIIRRLPSGAKLGLLRGKENAAQAGRGKSLQAGLAKVPGLFAVARHSGFRSLLA
jgi:hypothetical protein